MASGKIINNNDVLFKDYNMDNSVVSWTNTGTATLVIIALIIKGHECINLARLDIRGADLEATKNPVITIKNSDFSKLDYFLLGFPCGIRGMPGNLVPTDGGFIHHAAYSDTVTIQFYDYINTKVAGYIHLVK